MKNQQFPDRTPGDGGRQKRELQLYVLIVTACTLNFHTSGIRMKIEGVSCHCFDLTSLLQIQLE